MPDRPAADPKSWEALVAAALARLQGAGVDPGGRWLLVDVAGQRLALLEGDRVRRAWPVSTARAGIDGRDGSGGTPPGAHRIERRLGADAPAGTVFVSREPSGEVWSGADDERDLILTRILTLVGLEDGINRGPGVDSRERYIYLHGTNHEAALGRPVSHGCVRLSGRDVVDLFDRVEEGDPVVIL